MALDTYANFKTEIEEWVDRPDLSAKVDTWIDLAEAHIRRKCKGVEREIRAQATLTAGDRFLALPGDSRGMRNLSLAPSAGGALTQVTADYIDRLVERYDAAHSGTPEFFAVNGNELEIFPVPGADVIFEATYIQSLTPLSAGVTNVIFDEHPDIYMWSTLVTAHPYMLEDNRLPMFTKLRDDAIDDYNQDAEQRKYGASPLVMRPVRRATRRH